MLYADRSAKLADVTGDLPSAAGAAWVMRWTQLGLASLLDSGPATLTLWVGGPHYVTARADVTVPENPQR